MDSRAYVFIYPLRTNADIPDDFPPEVRTRDFETGVFLPQDDSNWFTRPPKYPARLLLLDGQSFHIIPHPTSVQSAVEIRLDELLQLETGTCLLLGWLRFTTASGVHEIIYNTRASRPLKRFLNRLKRAWCSAPSPIPSWMTAKSRSCSTSKPLSLLKEDSCFFTAWIGDRAISFYSRR
jgi:hypothetical protein